MTPPSGTMLTPPYGAMTPPSGTMLTPPYGAMLTPSVAPNRSICDYQTIDLPCVFLNISLHFYIFYILPF
jgi:hypothetical protein